MNDENSGRLPNGAVQQLHEKAQELAESYLSKSGGNPVPAIQSLVRLASLRYGRVARKIEDGLQWSRVRAALVEAEEAAGAAALVDRRLNRRGLLLGSAHGPDHIGDAMD